MDEQKEQIKENIKSNTRYRRWCMTCFDFDKYPTKESLRDAICVSPVRYLIIGQEITSTNEKPHYQVYIEYENGKSWNTMHKAFPNIYIAQAKGNCASNTDYCSKEDNKPLIVGTPNISETTMSKGDIASNIINYLYAQRGTAHLFDVAAIAPDMADYIVKNYMNLSHINNDINRHFKILASKGVLIDEPDEVFEAFSAEQLVMDFPVPKGNI